MSSRGIPETLGREARHFLPGYAETLPGIASHNSRKNKPGFF